MDRFFVHPGFTNYLIFCFSKSKNECNCNNVNKSGNPFFAEITSGLGKAVKTFRDKYRIGFVKMRVVESDVPSLQECPRPTCFIRVSGTGTTGWSTPLPLPPPSSTTTRLTTPWIPGQPQHLGQDHSSSSLIRCAHHK